MARGKEKESTLTPEEKLVQALVPVEEQPYKVPENWCWTKLRYIGTVKGGKRIPKGHQFSDEPTEHPYIRVTDFRDGGIAVDGLKYVNKSTFNQIKNYTISSSDIYVSIAGSIGKVGIIPLELDGANLTENAAKITDITGGDQMYLLRFLSSEDAQQQMAESTISTTQPKLALFRIEDISIPIPPLTEQQRIVDRIEYLFAKLDEAKEKAQSVLDSFETRKAAILHKAFTGELTAKWRAEHGVQLDTWQSVLFDNCIAKMQNGLAKRAGSNGIPFAVLRLANLSDDGFITDDLRQIVLDEKEQGNYRLMPNDVLMIRVNGSKDNVGKQFLMGDQKDWAFCDHIIRIRYSDGILPAYMVLFSKSDVYGLYVKDNMVSSAGQNTISRKGMAHLAVPVPSPDEQAEIIRILDSLFAKEQQAKETAEAVLEKIDLLKKSILARAFRGELGTNDPTEESTLELLKSTI